jgi:hypothetical protein
VPGNLFSDVFSVCFVAQQPCGSSGTCDAAGGCAEPRPPLLSGTSLEPSRIQAPFQASAPGAGANADVAGAPVGLVIGLSAVFVALIAAGAIIFAVWRRRHRRSFDDNLVELPEQVQHPVLNISSAELIRGVCLGEGAFGAVYRGQYRGHPVAIKQLRGVSSSAVGDFFREASVMLSAPAHPNIVRSIGMCQQQHLFSLVMELVPGGSLSSFLQNHGPLPDARARAVCQGIASGMACLAAENIVHRDLAARNVLLTEEFVPKVADFGFSRVVDEGGVGRTANDVGPIRWMSPEALRDRIFSEKSDVWAFGCLMVEMFTQGKAPFEELDLFRVAVMVRDEGHAPPIPPLAPDWARQLMEGCFQRQPEQRPRFQEICDCFDLDQLWGVLDDIKMFCRQDLSHISVC